MGKEDGGGDGGGLSKVRLEITDFSVSCREEEKLSRIRNSKNEMQKQQQQRRRRQRQQLRQHLQKQQQQQQRQQLQQQQHQKRVQTFFRSQCYTKSFFKQRWMQPRLKRVKLFFAGNKKNILLVFAKTKKLFFCVRLKL